MKVYPMLTLVPRFRCWTLWCTPGIPATQKARTREFNSSPAKAE